MPVNKYADTDQLYPDDMEEFEPPAAPFAKSVRLSLSKRFFPESKKQDRGLDRPMTAGAVPSGGAAAGQPIERLSLKETMELLNAGSGKDYMVKLLYSLEMR
jgi:hypothetical protein